MRPGRIARHRRLRDHLQHTGQTDQKPPHRQGALWPLAGIPKTLQELRDPDRIRPSHMRRSPRRCLDYPRNFRPHSRGRQRLPCHALQGAQGSQSTNVWATCAHRGCDAWIVPRGLLHQGLPTKQKPGGRGQKRELETASAGLQCLEQINGIKLHQCPLELPTPGSRPRQRRRTSAGQRQPTRRRAHEAAHFSHAPAPAAARSPRFPG